MWSCGGVFGFHERASGGAGGPERLHPPGLVERVFRHGLRVGGIELGSLIEVVREGLLGGLVLFRLAEAHDELGLRRCPGGMEERGRGRLTDVGKDSGDGLQIGEERDEREGCVAGWTDQWEDFINACQESGPLGRLGRPGRGGVRCLGWWGLWLGGRGHRARGERASLDGRLGGEGVVLAGPLSVTRGLRGALGAKTPW